MAGSFANFPPDDHLLSARLEGLKLLAHQLDEPIVIVDSNLRMVYANPSAGQQAKDCPLTDPEVTVERTESVPDSASCSACPAKEVVEYERQASSGAPPSVTEPPTGKSAWCPLPRAIPLGRELGGLGYVVMMGPRGRSSTVWSGNTLGKMVGEAMQRSSGQDLPELVGESPPMQRLIEMIHLVAASEATVLIQGESGTGKERVAKTIHRLSRRRTQPFVVVECSSLPETLLESELFGHVRGAFTGATTDRKGLFEEAEGGTIFLDEIADTAPVFQAKLLRVLQEGEIKPVGSNQSVKVDVRVIAASNRPLENLMKSKAFRLDLYYRLAVLPLTIPPLRERREDIPLLVHHFLAESCRKHGRSVPSVAEDAMEALVAHQWPGNVRELENLVERVVVTSNHSRLAARDFFNDLPSDNQADPLDLRKIAKAARQDAEKSRILDVLRRTGGDKTKAAKLLKISRASLYNKLKAYHIMM